MYQEMYATFKLSEFKFRLSVRSDENREKYKGDPKMWDKAEGMLKKALDDMNMDYYMGEGEAAFYGPKIDIQFRNLMGREETVSTIQVDFLAAENFNLSYINENNEEERPIVIHRAPLSTHERFISFLLEYYGGAFPTWCSPTQVIIIPVNDDCLEYCQELEKDLRAKMVRVKIDTSNASFNKKIRTNTIQKNPNILIIGNKEVEERTVTLRRYGFQEQIVSTKEEFIKDLLEEISTRKMLREPMGSLL
jgi:threonyl-tRNA synthetase